MRTVVIINNEVNKYWNDYVDREDRTVNIHIQIFDDLLKWCNKGEIKKCHDIPVIFTYWWLINYLWKYAKYGEHEISVNDIKQMLNLSPTTKSYDYVFKKGGLLDSKKWSQYETNYPIAYTYDNHIEYEMLNDLDEDERRFLKQCRGKNYFVKKPLLAYERILVDELGDEIQLDGTIWSKEDTFTLTFGEFKTCMENDELGVLGFYLFSYIKYKYKMYGKTNVGIQYSEFERYTGYKERKLRKVLYQLKDEWLINIDSQTERRESGIKTWNDYGIRNYTG